MRFSLEEKKWQVIWNIPSSFRDTHIRLSFKNRLEIALE
jgi:hypothetical protein